VIADFTIAKQSGEQGQGVLSEGGIDEWFLSFQGSCGATTWLAVIVEIRVHNLRK
jgi:hypothetical protein